MADGELKIEVLEVGELVGEGGGVGDAGKEGGEGHFWWWWWWWWWWCCCCCCCCCCDYSGSLPVRPKAPLLCNVFHVVVVENLLMLIAVD